MATPHSYIPDHYLCCACHQEVVSFHAIRKLLLFCFSLYLAGILACRCWHFSGRAALTDLVSESSYCDSCRPTSLVAHLGHLTKHPKHCVKCVYTWRHALFYDFRKKFHAPCIFSPVVMASRVILSRAQHRTRTYAPQVPSSNLQSQSKNVPPARFLVRVVESNSN